MKKHLFLLPFQFIIITFLFGCATKPLVKEEKPVQNVFEKSKDFVGDFYEGNLFFKITPGTRIDTIIIDTVKKTIKINFNKAFSEMPFRDENVNHLYNLVKHYFGKRFSDYKYQITTLNHDIKDLIPNFYRKDTAKYDYRRIPLIKEKRPLPVVRNVSEKSKPVNGLYDRNIVVWPSHGWYYNNKEDRWEWQRPRLFQSVEDLIPYSFTIPYLVPMLEKAGANVFVPRERDVQVRSVVVDNDTPFHKTKSKYEENSKDKKHTWKEGIGKAFAVGNPPYPVDFNPFKSGTHRITISDKKVSASASWIPDIPAEGKYAVYISYKASDANVNDAHYIVYHSGIKTEFKVNQQIGGLTWEYLGDFKFEKGFNPSKDKVVLINKSKEPGKVVSADAVRFGGGMGIVMRNGRTSGRPKFVEGSRYYLQYMGMPDTLVYNLHNDSNDYTDDYQSRPEYVNYLYGKPFGPNRDRDAKGLGIPIDLSMAFHTDAGITHNDTTVGTLSIYSLQGAENDTTFPNNVSRIASRDLADIMQTQIVHDIRAKYDPAWNRRQLKDGDYSESFRPNVPAVLVELLSHQNFLDMKFVQDPRFRFDVGRAMYKGMLKFLSVQDGFKYVVEPLPVKSFSTELNNKGNVVLKWQPVDDSLEPTAKPDKYIVYTRIGDGDFDNGIIVDSNYVEMKNIKPGVIYSYKVTAVNGGGESFPSEILSVCKMRNKKPVLIINGFDRVASPATVSSEDFNGFLESQDPGVPDKYDVSLTGSQFNFDSTSQWISNDQPGWGASHANYETKVIAGNTFDYTFIHGESIKANGFPFVSTSVKAVINGTVDLANYKFVDLILGEQKTTGWERAIEDSLHGLEFKTFPKKLQEDISAYCKSGGNIFVSGSYVGSDLFKENPVDTTDINFAENVLRYKWDTDHATVTGKVFCADSAFMPRFEEFIFNHQLNDKIYAVTAPDAIRGINGSKTILRYNENQFSAGTGYKGNYGTVVLGFPFETIAGQKTRNTIMKSILHFLGF